MLEWPRRLAASQDGSSRTAARRDCPRHVRTMRRTTHQDTSAAPRTATPAVTPNGQGSVPDIGPDPRRVRRPRPRLRLAAKIGGVALALVLLGASGALIGDLLTAADFRLGPHQAELRVIPQRAEIIDLGPIGSFV